MTTKFKVACALTAIAAVLSIRAAESKLGTAACRTELGRAAVLGRYSADADDDKEKE